MTTPTSEVWEQCGGPGCDREFVIPDPIPKEAYWLRREYGIGSVFCSEDCCINHAERQHERVLEQFYGGTTWP